MEMIGFDAHPGEGGGSRGRATCRLRLGPYVMTKTRIAKEFHFSRQKGLHLTCQSVRQSELVAVIDSSADSTGEHEINEKLIVSFFLK